MAQFTESSATGILPYRSPYGMFPIRNYPESSASTFSYGDLVSMGTGTNSHRITQASSNSTAYLGVAGESGSSDSSNRDTRRPIYMAYPDVEFRGWIKEVILSTMVGQLRGFARDTTRAIDYLAANSTDGENRCVITEIGSTSGDGLLAGIGDTNGYVAFRFLGAFAGWRPGSSVYPA